MTRLASAVLAGLFALPPAALALPPCVGADLATPLPDASEVSLPVMDIPAARFPGQWQQGQFKGFAYRVFPDLTAIVFDERANTGWRIDLQCTEALRCVSSAIGSVPEAAFSAAKAIGDCLLPAEKPAAAPASTAKPAPSPAPAAAAKPAPAPAAKPAPSPAPAAAADAKPAQVPAAKPAPSSAPAAAKPAQEPAAKPASASDPGKQAAKSAPGSKAAVPDPAAKPAAKPAAPLAAAGKPAAPSAPADRAKAAVSAAPPGPAPSQVAQAITAGGAAKAVAMTAGAVAPKPVPPVAAAPAPKAARVCPAPSPQDAGSAIRAIQRLLVSAGQDPGPIDGSKGKRTRLALEATVGPEIAKLDPVSVLIALTAMICSGADPTQGDAPKK